jgi:polyhydroxyalkanoate synthase
MSDQSDHHSGDVTEERGGELRVIESARVEQVIDRGERGVFRKEVLELTGEPPLRMVRKVLPEAGPRLGSVVLVHGFAQNRYTWHTSRRSAVNWLAARGWDVYNLELRGHGRSRTERALGVEQFSDYVEDVVRVARAFAERGEPAFFVGHSLGGAACYGAATEAPMAGVIGVGALFSFAQANWFLKLLGVLTHQLADTPMVHRLTLRTRVLGRIMARLYAISDVAGYTLPISGWWPGSVEPALLEERLVKGFDWTSVRVWLEMSRWAATGRFDYEDAWRKTDVPLLVLCGDKDHLLPPGDARRAYDLSGSSDKTFVVFDDFHHEVHWGHLDLILGRLAYAHTWPAIEGWMRSRRPGVPDAA